MRKYRVNVHRPGAGAAGIGASAGQGSPIGTGSGAGYGWRRRPHGTVVGNGAGYGDGYMGAGTNAGGFGGMAGGCASGCLRYLLWLLLALLLLALLSGLLRGCSNGGRGGFPPVENNDPVNGTSPYPENPRPMPDPDDGTTPYPGNGVLPNPDDNHVAPIPDDGGVKDPEKRKYISPNVLNVALRSDGEGIVQAWAEKFKSLYPDDKHYVNYFNDLTHMLQITVPSEERESIKNNLNSQMPEFDFLVFDNDVITRQRTFNDPALGRKQKDWYLKAVQAYDAWDITCGDSSIVVAVVDNFFDVTHPELSGKIYKPYSVSRRNEDVAAHIRSKGDIHGTHVASTAVGIADNGEGICGIAPGCRLMPVMVGTDGSPYMDTMSEVDGIMYAIYQGADVVNISIGMVFTSAAKRLSVEEQRYVIHNSGKVEEKVWDYIFEAAEKHNTVLVWAAGNDDIVSGMDPSKRYSKTIRVSAVDNSLSKTGFSNFGVFDGECYSTVSAPGKNIYNAVPFSKYDYLSGTSMAAPIVTGAVALMKSLDRNLTSEEIISILQKTGKPVKGNVGNLIQIKDALKAVQDGMMNYDDVLKDPEKILGVWKSTTPLFSSHTRVPLVLYMKFTSTTTGQLIIHENESGLDFTAPLSVAISPSGISLKQLDKATCASTGTKYIRYFYACTPDDNRNCLCHASPREDIAEDVTFNLRKIQ